MRTMAARERDLNEGRYSPDADDIDRYDPNTMEGAKAILSSRGGKKAGQLAIAAMWRAHKAENGTRRAALHIEAIPAPMRVLRALATLGLAEETHNDVGLMDCYRLTESGLRAALVAEKAAGARNG